jgi:hypothetical protein
MYRYFLIAVSALIMTTIHYEVAYAQNNATKVKPLNLSWGESLPKTFRELQGFQYYYGDVEWGEIIFTGDLFNLDAEVQIKFLYQKITDATLILGPRGLDIHGCLKIYKDITKLMIQKYGNPYLRKIHESAMKEELVYGSLCRSIRIGLYTVETHWNIHDFFIIASVFGDDVDIFIEIEYIYKPLIQHLKKHKIKKLLKHL